MFLSIDSSLMWMNVKPSMDVDWNETHAPKNFIGLFLIESKSLPPRENGTILGKPLHIDRFLHFSGLSVRFIEEVILWSSLMSRWWVLLLLVIRLKSSAYGSMYNYNVVCMYVCIIIILCNNVSFYRYRVSQEDGSMPCDRPVNVLLYLLFYYCAKLHLLLLCHWRIKFLLLLLLLLLLQGGTIIFLYIHCFRPYLPKSNSPIGHPANKCSTI